MTSHYAAARSSCISCIDLVLNFCPDRPLYQIICTSANTETMSVVLGNWQTTRPTITERSKFIFNNDLFSDVKFVIGKMDSESSRGQRRKLVIPAHKLVLSIGSPVFEAMFYGKLAETSDSIELPDCEYDSLLELFRYMYSDEVNLSGSNVMGVLYLAKKYMVPSLADKCMEYLERNVDPTNLFSILSCAQKYEEKSLVDRCWEVVDKQTEKTVKSDEFATIERSLFETIVVRDGLTIEEIDLFKAVDLWVTKECERQGLAVDGAVKRKILGETLVKALRFPTMKLEDFACIVLDSKILTPDEIVTIVKCLSSVPTSPVEFPKIRRAGFRVYIQRCCRFDHFVLGSYLSYSTPSFTLDFSVDKDITLHGVCLFGDGNSNYSLDLAIIKDAKEKQVMVSKRQSEKFSSSSLRCKAGSYCGFEVMLDRGVGLVKNTMYRLQAELTVLTGSLRLLPSGRAVNHALCSGVTFAFDNSVHGSTLCGYDLGQFPELLFTL